jgi:predicted kinase
LVGGFKDIKNNFIKTVGNAVDRFDEDPLRKMRILRFAFRMGGSIDKAALDALKQDPTLKGISPERIRDEFIKSINSSKNTKDYLKTLLGIKMIQHILPNHNISDSDFINSNNYQFVLAYIFRNKNVKEISNYLNKIKYSVDDIKNITFLIELYKFSPNDIHYLKNKEKTTSLSPSDILEWGKIIRTNFSKFVKFKLSISGNDVMKMGYSGKDIGNAIKDLEKKRYLSEAVDRPVITFLIGPPASGKSTWVSSNKKNSIIISRDDIVDKMRIPYGWSYAETFNHWEFQKKVNEVLKNNINNALKSGKNIIVDMTNMSKKSRSIILNKVPKEYVKNAVVFNVGKDELIKRLNKRERETGKYVSMDVVDKMIKSYEAPTHNEFDNIKVV